MNKESNVTVFSQETQGLLFGALGVLAFSFTVPLTRVAVGELDGAFVGLGRALVAAALAGLLLAVTRQRFPERRFWPGLFVVGLGVIVGFPLLTSLALRELTAAHGAVIVGLLPAATAVMAVLRAGERPSRAFWGACAFGLVAVLLFAASQGMGGRPRGADLLVLLAVLCGAVGYAEGGALAREMGGWRVISWSLVLFAPLLAPFVVLAALSSGVSAGAGAWLSFGYVSVVSMFLGFFAWYRGLAQGGVARVGQVQLAQPVLTLTWSALLLGERVGPPTILCAVLVLGSVAVGQRTRVRTSARHKEVDGGDDA